MIIILKVNDKDTANQPDANMLILAGACEIIEIGKEI
jgi:hypothetical protein